MGCVCGGEEGACGERERGCKYVLKVHPMLPRVPGITSEDFDIKYIWEETQ